MSVEIDDRAMMRSLDTIERRAHNLAPAMRAIGGILVADAQLAFRELRDPWGHPWEPLSIVTLFRRADRRTRGGMFKRNGEIKHSALRIIGSPVSIASRARV